MVDFLSKIKEYCSQVTGDPVIFGFQGYFPQLEPPFSVIFADGDLRLDHTPETKCLGLGETIPEKGVEIVDFARFNKEVRIGCYGPGGDIKAAKLILSAGSEIGKAFWDGFSLHCLSRRVITRFEQDKQSFRQVSFVDFDIRFLLSSKEDFYNIETVNIGE